MERKTGSVFAKTAATGLPKTVSRFLPRGEMSSEDGPPAPEGAEKPSANVVKALLNRDGVLRKRTLRRGD